MNKTLAKSAATPAKKVPAKVAPVKSDDAPPPAKASAKPRRARRPRPWRCPRRHPPRSPTASPTVSRRRARRCAAMMSHLGRDPKPLAKADPKLANAWKTKAAAT